MAFPLESVVLVEGIIRGRKQKVKGAEDLEVRYSCV
jgi:hypothetical protein